MISSSQGPLPENTQHSQKRDIHASCGIRTHSLSRRAAADVYEVLGLLIANNEGHERDYASRTLRYANIYLGGRKETKNPFKVLLTVRHAMILGNCPT